MSALGLIGAGNMGEAILRGILSNNVLQASEIHIFDINREKLQSLENELNINTTASLNELLNRCDYLLLAVKPNVCEKVLRECPSAFANKVLMSIVTGWSRERINAILPKTCRILRIMPNTPCLVGEGMCVFDADHTLNDADLNMANKIFSAVGQVEMVQTSLMDAVTGVSGSGPAYVYLFIEAMADAGVQAGLPRSTAYKLASQTVLGAAKMVLQTGEHPGVLKDAVCSPGGTTIDAVASLERSGLRATIIDAIDICCKKANLLSK